MRTLVKALIYAVLLIIMPLSALAQNEDKGFYFTTGPVFIDLAVSASVSAAGSVVPGGDVSADNNVTLGFGIGYRFSPNVSIVALLGLPPETTIYGEGSLEGLTAGDLRYGPAVFAANYHFQGLGNFQPFIGAGLNVTLALGETDENIDDFNAQSLVAPSARIGFDYMFNDKVGLFATALQFWGNTEVTGTVNPAIPDLGGAPTVSDVDLTPLIYQFGLTYRL